VFSFSTGTVDFRNSTRRGLVNFPITGARHSHSRHRYSGGPLPSKKKARPLQFRHRTQKTLYDSHLVTRIASLSQIDPLGG